MRTGTGGRLLWGLVVLLALGAVWRAARSLSTPPAGASLQPVPQLPPPDRPGMVPVYFLKGDTLHPAYRPIGPDTPEHALRQLLAGPTAAERRLGITTALPAGARLLRCAPEGIETVVDFSDAGAPEAIPRAAAQVAATLWAFPQVRAVRVCAEGRPLRAILRSQFLHPTPTPALSAEGEAPPQAPGAAAWSAPKPPGDARGAAGPLAGKVIVVNGGHGLTRFSSGRWRYQRPFYDGLVEDRVNTLIAADVCRELRALGATVYSTRTEGSPDEPGVSGRPRWEEAARYHLRDIGLPDWVYQPLPTDFESDIDARPLYANYRMADLLISLHHNIGPATGTLTLYDTGNGFGPASGRLARLLHQHVVRAIREACAPGWRSLGTRGWNGRYGENHWAQMPAALLEIGFISSRRDREWIRTRVFREAVARAVAAAVAEYFGASPAPLSGDAPAPRTEPAVAARPAEPPVALCLGDPAGAPEAAYAGPLRARIAAEGWRVVDAAGRHETIEWALARWDQDVAPRRPAFVLIAFGRNDLAAGEDGRPRVPLPRFEAGLVEAVRRTRALGAIPVLATIAPIRDSQRPGTGGDGAQARRDAYNAAIRRAAERASARLADVSRAAWQQEGEWLASGDAPSYPLTPAALARIADIFLAELQLPR